MRRVTESKQRSFAQRVGTAGENQFRLMADYQHLTVAIKVPGSNPGAARRDH
jgi:hypothetical protein